MNEYDFNDLIGKPYKENGRGPDGYDCYGVYMEINRRIGIEVPEQEEILKGCKFYHVEQLKTGDAVLIDTPDGPHVGVMEDSKTMIHTSSRLGSVHRIRIDHPQISGRIRGFYRYVV